MTLRLRLREEAGRFWCGLDNHPDIPRWEDFEGDSAAWLHAKARFTRDQMLAAGREDLAAIVEGDYPKAFAPVQFDKQRG